MTREEAIKGLTSLVEVRRKYCDMQTMRDEIEALDVAIKALEQEPETVTEFADRCRECGAKYEELLKQYQAFTEWVAREMFSDDWNFNKDSFAELACRKLANLGIVRAKGDEWELVELQTESEEEE